MNLPNSFEYYLSSGVIRKCFIDKSRANFLIAEAQNSFEGLNERIDKIGINEKNANSIIKDCHDILMELIRARLLLDGYNSSGQYAHEAEVSYLMKTGSPLNEVIFINELRHFRNSATYYGKILDKDYAEKVVKSTYKVYPKLLQEAKGKLKAN